MCLLDWHKGLTIETFRKTREALLGSYWIDTQHYATAKGTVNPQGVYKMFGEFSLTNTGEVWRGLIEWISDRKDEINDNLKIVLGQKSMSFGEWLQYMSEYINPSDELAIYCLARMYSHHVVIYTSTYCWSTLLRHFMYTEKEIHILCEIKLILLGKHKFAHVRLIRAPFGIVPTPFAPKVKVKDEEKQTKVKTEEKPTSKKRKRKNRQTVHKVTCRGQVFAKKQQNYNITTKNIIPDQNRPHNTRPAIEVKRISTKPLRESRKRINYALLNDGLDAESPHHQKNVTEKKLDPRPLDHHQPEPLHMNTP